MKKFILTDSNNVIMNVANKIETKEDRYYLEEENLEVFKDYPTQDMKGNVTHNYISCYELEGDFDKVVPQKYCYDEENGFYENPNYVEPPKPVEERLNIAEDSITEIELALTEIYEGGM